MGVSSSRIEEDKALQLCRERKRFVRQALDGRCSLAAAHVTYIESLKNTGTALRKFIEPEATSESSLYTSTTAISEPHALTEKSLSQISLSPSLSRHVDVVENFSPIVSPPNAVQFQANCMKTGGSSSTLVEERPPFAVTGILRSSLSTPQNLTPRSGKGSKTPPFEGPLQSHGTSPWDYFGLPVQNRLSFRNGRESNDGLDNTDDIGQSKEGGRLSDYDEEEQKICFRGRPDTQESEDEFEEPSRDNLVRSFKNFNRVDTSSTTMFPTMPFARNIISETNGLDGGKVNTPDLKPLKGSCSAVRLPTDGNQSTVKGPDFANKLVPKDFISSIKEIEYHFLRASESGKEVPRMLEANKVHCRPIFSWERRASKKSNFGVTAGSRSSMFLKGCFSCGEDPTHASEEPASTEIKYLTWHSTTSSHSTSSRNLLGSTPQGNIEDMSNSLFSSSCMNSGSHASTLDRLYAWERKLYDEIKASGIIRREYDMKCKLLRLQDSRGESPYRIDKTRQIVKDLHSRIRVAIHRIDSISKRIEELRDKELQPQLEELIEGLSRMWEKMFERHKVQLNIISIAYNSVNAKVYIESESHQQAAIHLEHEMRSLSSSFLKWTSTQKSYVQAIDGWLHKCVSLQQKSSRWRRKIPDTPLRNRGPPIFVTCGVWLDKLEVIPTREVADAMKSLMADARCFLPRHEKNSNKSSSLWKPGDSSEAMVSIPRDEATQEDLNSGFDSFRSSLVGFLDRLNCFAESSVKMYVELNKAIEAAKISYNQGTVGKFS